MCGFLWKPRLGVFPVTPSTLVLSVVVLEEYEYWKYTFYDGKLLIQIKAVLLKFIDLKLSMRLKYFCLPMEYLNDTEHRTKKKTSILLKCNSMFFFISKISIIIHSIYFDHVWDDLDKSANKIQKD